MNAIATMADLSADVPLSTRPGVELLYTPAESLFAAAAPDMLKNGWSVFPQEINRRPGSVYGATIQWGSGGHDLAHARAFGPVFDIWWHHCATLNVACVFGPASGHTFALDIDVDDEAISAEICALAEESLGYTTLRRQGRFPRVALIYRHAADDVVASRSRWLLNKDGSTSEHGIEIQGAGKLLTFHGRHHKTGRYFNWLDANPQVVGPETAPLVTSAAVDAFMQAVEYLHGFASHGNKSRSTGTWAPGVVFEGEKAEDGREQALFRLVSKVANSFDPAFWAAVDEGEAAVGAYKDGKLKEICDQFAAQNVLSGRWAPHLLANEALYRLDHWIGKMKRGKRPAPEKMARAAHKAGLGVPGNDNLPRVQMVAGRIFDAVDAAERALRESDLGVYQRAGKIVGLGMARVSASGNGEIDTLKIIDRGDKALAEDLARVLVFEQFDGRTGANKVVHVPDLVVQTLMQREGRWTLDVLAGFVSAPTLRADGSLLDVPGYDKATGLFYNPQGAVFPEIPEAPTREQALLAMGKLKHLIETFPFVGEPDRASILSMLLTACVRRTLPTAPLHGISATTPGSGKSMLQDLASILTTGRRAPVFNQAADQAETDKRLTGMLMAGMLQIAIDNCNAPLDGDLLNSTITQSLATVRPLGSSVTREVATNALVTATGNNLVVLGDLVRRSVICRLDAGCEHPEHRAFANDPVDDAMRDRGELVAAALTVLRAYQVAGRPAQRTPLGSFVVWSRTVRDALI